MVKQRETEGAILEINIENQYYVYAQILKKKLGFVFFDYRTKEKLTDFQILNDAKVLFVLSVYKYVVNQGIWLKVGKLPIRDSLLVLPMEFIQDALHPDRFELYNPNTGEITKTTKEQCRGLERAAVWAENHVEDRIRDHYSGVPCGWLRDDYELWGETDKVKWLKENLYKSE